MTRTLLCLVLLLAAAPAAGQRIDSPYRFLDHGQHVGLFVGHVGADEGPLGLGPQPSAMFGARWAMRVTSALAIGAEVGYAPTTRTVRDTVLEPDTTLRVRGEADMRLISVMGLLHFSIIGPRTWHGLHPSILLGAGAIIDAAGAVAVEEEIPAAARYDFGTSFAGQFGGSVEWFPTQRVSVRVDARNMLWRIGAPEAFRRTTVGAHLGEGDWVNNFAVLAGLSFHF